LNLSEPVLGRPASWDDWLTNAGCDLHWQFGQPVSLSRQPLAPDATYIFSPFRGWFDYLAHELRGQSRPWSARLVGLLAWVARLLGFERMGVIGAGPVSTSLHQPSDFDAILAATRQSVQRDPSRTFAIRNLTTVHHAPLMQALAGLGFVRLPSRVVYEFDGRPNQQQAAGLKTPSHLARDLKQLDKSGLRVCRPKTISMEQAGKLRQLYQRIYLDKYSPLNAQYTDRFFFDVVNTGVMRLVTLEAAGEWMGFALLMQVGEQASVPALGYSTDCEALGGYRLVFAAIFRETVLQGLLLNYSSGAGDFKRKRGATPVLEYTMVRAPTGARLLSWLLAMAERVAVRLKAEDLMARGA